MGVVSRYIVMCRSDWQVGVWGEMNKERRTEYYGMNSNFFFLLSGLHFSVITQWQARGPTYCPAVKQINVPDTDLALSRLQITRCLQTCQ
jgi:hypothetical protein